MACGSRAGACQPSRHGARAVGSRLMALLSVENVTRRFGGVVALDDVSLAVDEGQIAGLIGPNGAGKTTAFNIVTRLYAPDSGTVSFVGKDLLRLPPHRIARLGVARTFQNIVLFSALTVLQNVLVGTHSRRWYFAERKARRDPGEGLDYLRLLQIGGGAPP